MLMNDSVYVTTECIRDNSECFNERQMEVYQAFPREELGLRMHQEHFPLLLKRFGSRFLLWTCVCFSAILSIKLRL